MTNAAIGAAGSAEDPALADDDSDGDACGLGLKAKPLLNKLGGTLSLAAQGLAHVLSKTHVAVGRRV